MRAACIATQDERQVAVLVPTTLLDQHHLQNFRDRFADWPVRVESLSRFGSQKEQREVLDGLARGTVDIIIGTQLVAKGHNFPRLTLVGVIDADLGLQGSDLRAAERTFQLMRQVAGRAGRAELST